jgi:hypothetical protein
MREWEAAPLLKVTCFNEFWWDRDRRQRETAGYDLCIAHHENDLGRFRELGMKVAHIPHSADRHTFLNTRSDRTESPLLSGTCSSQHYPFRCRLQQMVKSGSISARLRTHPGYWMKNERKNMDQVADYASDLAKSQISLCTSSRWRYALAKYFESWLSGCCVAGDLPDDSVYREHFSDLQIVLERDWDDETLAAAVNGAVDVRERAEEGRRRALENFTTEHYARRLLRVLDGEKEETNG